MNEIIAYDPMIIIILLTFLILSIIAVIGIGWKLYKENNMIMTNPHMKKEDTND